VNSKSLLATSIVAICILAASVVAGGYYLTTSPSHPSTSLVAEEKTISTPLEGKTSVEQETMVAKVDFSRKIITLSTPAQKASLEKTLASVGGTIISESEGTTFVVQLSKDTLAEQQQALEELGSVETDFPVAVVADKVDWGIERVFAPKVWDRTTGDKVKVAILDTGIDASHPDLAGMVDARFDFTTNTAGGTDKHGHGTHVAGIIASSKNETGYVGASYQARLLAAKVLSDDGIGYVSDVVEGINWARSEGAQIINLSIGTTHDSKSLKDAVNKAANAGVIVVAAAGNTNGGAMTYPGAYSSVISVGATDKQDRLASFSAVGASVVAPGVSITSALPGGSYASWSGTSMAAPHVAAAAALLIAKGETNVRSKLTDSAISVNGLKLINVETAVSGTDTLAPLISITNPKTRSTISGTVILSASTTDESGINEVIFSLNNTELKRFTAEPYELAYDTTTIPDGDHIFYVTASDQIGNSGIVQVSLTINNSGASPSPSTSPGTGRQDSTNNSQEVRQDTGNSSQEVRQDATSATPPTGTNAGQRSQKSASLSPSSHAPTQTEEKKPQGQSRIQRIFHGFFR
jgi:subtilisin family serine protease